MYFGEVTERFLLCLLWRYPSEKGFSSQIEFFSVEKLKTGAELKPKN